MDVTISLLERQARITVTADDQAETEPFDGDRIVIYFGDYFRRCDAVIELARGHLPGLIESLTQLLKPMVGPNRPIPDLVIEVEAESKDRNSEEATQ